MPIDRQELARRLRSAREACRLRQEDVASHLGVSRSTIGQIELGKREVTSLELDKLAYLYGRDIREFLSEDFREDDALVALFRRHPEVSDQEEVVSTLRECLAVGREIRNLERLLRVDRDLTAVPSYVVRPPGNKWEAVQQGERVAAEERRRLDLGTGPLPNVAGLLEAQGVQTEQRALPGDISGVTLSDPEVGVLVAVNNRPPAHSYARRRFSYAHEYCHVLLDRDQKGTISRASDRDKLAEVRANTFAAAFLMPKAGVEEFIYNLAKGRPSRRSADVFDEQEALPARARTAPRSQVIQLHDVVLLAHHFGVSRIAALYRVKNLGLLKEREFKDLKHQEEQGLGKELADLFALEEPDQEKAGSEFRYRFLILALEGYRRGEITRSKLRELGYMVGVTADAIEEVLMRTGLGEQDDGAISSPPEG
jgi:Zn-dependent peptidase ImmA (M78 family)/transcriptional regulator with XRE-family HTH domain